MAGPSIDVYLRVAAGTTREQLSFFLTSTIGRLSDCTTRRQAVPR